VAIVFVPAPLRRLTGGVDRLQVAGDTVGALVDAIDAAHPGFRARVVDGGELLPSLAVSVDGDLVTRGLDEPVTPASEVHFVPALGGGQDDPERGEYLRIFEARGGSYNAAHALVPAARDAERAHLLARLALGAGLRVLDVPAGGGYVADGLRAAAPDARIVCVEPAAAFVAGVDRRLTRVRADAASLPFAGASFDRVASLAGTHHLADRAAFFRACRRVLRRGGRFVVADALQGTAVAEFLNGPVDRLTATGHEGRFFAPGEAAALLEAAGFGDVVEEHLAYDWCFPDHATMVRYCRLLFGMVRGDADDVERALRAHFTLASDASGARLPWSLVYASGVIA
jgi:ubiquinone/menaquinone biosynthesis C-methylase UbiE